jgi:MFS family permease
LAYLAVGTGVSCVYVPAVANVGGWFVRHRVQAIGVAVTGIGVGTIFAPVITVALVDAVGWRRTDMYLGVAALGLLVACAPFMSPAVHKRHSKGSWSERRLVGDRTFRVLWLSGFAMGLVMFVPFVFLAPMAEHGGVTPARAAVLISVIGFASTGARVLFGLLAARVGVVFAYKATTVTIWSSFLVWLPSRSFTTLVIFALAFGAGYGGTIALSPSLLSHYYGTDSLGTVSGANFTSASIGALFGAPLAGLLIGPDDRYLLAAIAAFVVACLGTIGQVLLPTDHPTSHPAPTG